MGSEKDLVHPRHRKDEQELTVSTQVAEDQHIVNGKLF